MKKLGEQLHSALACDTPAELVALVVTTNHPKRLQELFTSASQRLLEAHRAVLQWPNSQDARYQRTRSKALLDLVRARIAAVGWRKPSVGKMLSLLDSTSPPNVIDIRQAA